MLKSLACPLAGKLLYDEIQKIAFGRLTAFLSE